VGVAEELYVRLVIIALGGLQFLCGLAVIAALVRTQNANFVRTTGLAVGIALLAALALRDPRRRYREMRRRPVLSLTAPIIGLTALVIDGVGHSPLSYVATVTIALPAFVCGRRWALASATLISLGALTAATLSTGSFALGDVGLGAVGYFVWALVLSGLAESFVQLTMRMPPIIAPAPAPEPPLRIPNLAGDPLPTDTPAEAPPPATTRGSPEPPSSPSPLSARQLQVVALLADGLGADEIAERLGIATSTVYRHVKQAKQRTGIATRSELVALAIRDGLVPAGRS
jgi:DNA-binding CsgD family transcriptional regulator